MDTLQLEHRFQFETVYNEIGRPELEVILEVEPLINWKREIIYGDFFDFTIFKKALNQNGTYFIYNCSCGIPECGGYEKGIDVKVKNDLVYFEDLDGNKEWVFEFSQIKEEIKKIKKALDELIPQLKSKEIKFSQPTFDGWWD